MSRSGKVAAVTAALILGGLVVGLEVRARGERRTAEQVRGVLKEAAGLVAAARGEGLYPLAAASYAKVESDLAEARALLEGGRAAAALPVAESALSAARAARDEALGHRVVPRAAELRAIRNRVLYRAADAVAWTDARAPMSLYDHDRISTKERSEALVRFDEGNELRIEENSVMVVESIGESRAEAGLSMTLSLTEGGIRSQLSRDRDRDSRLQINLPKAGLVVDTAKLPEGRAEVGTRVAPDRSQRIAVYAGEAELVAASGSRVVVRENHYAEVDPEGQVSQPQTLPTAAVMLLPGQGARVFVSANRPEVAFKWRADGSPGGGYRVEVARDGDFLDKVVDRTAKGLSITAPGLGPGRYRWRMSCLDPRGNQGPYTAASAFEVVLDDKPPELSVLAPDANAVVKEAAVEARCRTEGEIAVFINGEEASRQPGGLYTRLVSLRPGLNTLVFEAVDEAGNVMYSSRLVTRTP